jgi:hypothetical protein
VVLIFQCSMRIINKSVSIPKLSRRRYGKKLIRVNKIPSWISTCPEKFQIIRDFEKSKNQNWIEKFNFPKSFQFVFYMMGYAMLTVLIIYHLV